MLSLLPRCVSWPVQSMGSGRESSVWLRALPALRCCDAVHLERAAQDADLEVVARGAGDCWVSARVDGLRALTVVLEGRGEGGLQVGRCSKGFRGRGSGSGVGRCPRVQRLGQHSCQQHMAMCHITPDQGAARTAAQCLSPLTPCRRRRALQGALPRPTSPACSDGAQAAARGLSWSPRSVAAWQTTQPLTHSVLQQTILTRLALCGCGTCWSLMCS
jgi:hypothetical protein